MTAICGAWAKARPPWKEAFHVYAARGSVGDGKPKHMFGRVTLTLGEYEPQVGQFRTVDPGDEALVAYADARWAVSQLEAWARLYRVPWDVEFDGVRGRVHPGGLDSAAARTLAGMYERAARPAEGRLERLRAAIDRSTRTGGRPGPNWPPATARIRSSVMPMIFLSGAFFPLSDLPAGLLFATRIDPLTYSIDGLRGALLGASQFELATDVALLSIIFTARLLRTSVRRAWGTGWTQGTAQAERSPSSEASDR